ncbi:MAG: hypothetical protein AB7Q00_07220 [Phycisphaerales bacterium]|nr:MAG: hypothetical protein IPK69_11625 [Phycisphaerales bacterium]
MPTTPDNPNRIYVGYLPAPREHRDTVRLALPLIMILLAIVASLAALAQRSPGNAVWHVDTNSWTGTILAEPQPMLIVSEHQGPSVILLVAEGKHGIRERIKPFNHTTATIKGTLLERDHRRMIEVASSPDAMASVATTPDSPPREIPTPKSLGPITITGEVIDPKCYLGAMKPGEGKAHRACAILCIQGGIPPMLLSRDATGIPTYYLLTDAQGHAATIDTVRDFVGMPTTITGTLEQLADLHILRAESLDHAGR